MSQKPDSNFKVEQASATDDSIQQVHTQLRSQKPEKKGGYPMFPLVVLGMICTAVFFGSIYMVHNSVRFDPLVVNEHAKREKPGPAGPVKLSRHDQGKKVFATCAACHQPSGMGQPGVYPPLAGSEWVQGDTAREERIIRIVLHGLTGPITVKGNEFNNTMAPLGGAFNDEQIANVLSYVRQEWGNKAADVEPETVAKIRAETADHKGFWTAAELLKIAP